MVENEEYSREDFMRGHIENIWMSDNGRITR
jgi:hypothetical protein